jgi:F420-dependent oxidoreductase-like protein
MSQIFGLDSLTALAVVGPEFPGLDLGVSVVPVYGRHPLVLAMQARTVHTAVGGRLILGIGPSHQITVEGLFGDSYARPYTRTAEYLRALLPLLAGEAADVNGEELTARGLVTIDAPTGPPVLVAALGPKMLRLAGEQAAGTSLWMVGPRTIAGHIVPTISRAASDAGRPPPRVLAGVTACVTDDPDAARERAASEQAMYATLPAYQRVMQAEGVDGPADLVIAGDEDTVADGLRRYGEAGATDLRVTIIAAGDGERDRTRAVLRSLT